MSMRIAAMAPNSSAVPIQTATVAVSQAGRVEGVDVGRDGRPVFEAMLREGIIVRHIEGPMVRVTVGLEEENREFLAALKRVIHPH